MARSHVLAHRSVAGSDLWTPETAAAFWTDWVDRCDETVWDRFMAAEQYLLEHPPADLNQAEVLLTVLIANADAGADAAPLRRLQAFLAALANDKTSANRDVLILNA
ncbi:hypothetical protein BZG35_08345 [Brevundimonas sp. LM2]|uniref:hypothetical protein n=1 Tax=Brevundimonas sp. LM2 TaxID=1938605 RepID=UPI0009838DF3|nr:hypothetical protein [Brevundimonas sp. LM2]AQR61659.1 hypothetical protein BZG35_08345 [Brevundimonas sp. LM2]